MHASAFSASGFGVALEPLALDALDALDVASFTSRVAEDVLPDCWLQAAKFTAMSNTPIANATSAVRVFTRALLQAGFIRSLYGMALTSPPRDQDKLLCI